MLVPERPEGRNDEPARGRLESSHAQAPAEARLVIQRGFGRLERVERLAPVAREHAAGVRQHNAAPDRLGEALSGLALELRQLLRDGRRGVAERVGDGGEAAALLELDQEAQPGGAELISAMLIDNGRKEESIYEVVGTMLPACRTTSHSSESPPRPSPCQV